MRRSIALQVASHLFEAAHNAHFEADYTDQRVWRSELVF